MNDIDKLQEEVRQLKQRLSQVEAAPKNPPIRVTFVDRNGFEKVEYKHETDLKRDMAMACKPYDLHFWNDGSPWSHDPCGMRQEIKRFRMVRRSSTEAVYQEYT